jgi:hypothetical protein
MITVIRRAFVQVKKSFFLSLQQDRLKRVVESMLPSAKKEPSGRLIVVQCVEDYYYWGLFLSIISALRMEENISVEQYVVRSLRPHSSKSIKQLLVSLAFSNGFSDSKWISLYAIFCNKVAFRTTGAIRLLFDMGLFFKALAIWSNLSSKQELLELKCNDVVVGDLIYDSYLRFKPAPTVDLKNPYLLVVIWQAMRTFKYAKRYFAERMPIGYLTSYATYIQHGIPVRVALRLGIPVYSFGSLQVFAKKLDIEDWSHPRSAANYREGFDRIPNKEEMLNQAREQLLFRISGGVDSATSYMAKSAYAKQSSEVPNVDGAVVVFLHDFFDSPHVYRWILFPDFLEWICFTIDTLTEMNIPFFLKPHPNQIELSSSVIDSLKDKYPNLFWIPSTITNLQLVEAGMRCAITVYGTVAHEMAFLGVPTIASGDHPHISFDFCHTAVTVKEYRELLGRALHLDFDKAQMQLQSMMFYYMHNLNKIQKEGNVIEAIQQFHSLTRIESLLDEYVESITAAIRSLMDSKDFQLICQQIFLNGYDQEQFDAPNQGAKALKRSKVGV